MRFTTTLTTTLTLASALFAAGCTNSIGGSSTDHEGVLYETLSVAHDGSQYVIVGERWDTNVVGPSRPLLMTSPDGHDFTVRDDDLPAIPLNSVAYGNGRFLAVGGQLYQEGQNPEFLRSSTALSSADGVTWEPVQGVPEDFLWKVVFGNGTFLAIGFNGDTYHSTDGLTLTPGPKLGGIATVNGVSFGAGKFLVYGDSPSVFVSTDGSTFSTVPIPTDHAAVDYTGSEFLGYGAVNSGVEYTGEARGLRSPDGVTWSMSNDVPPGATLANEGSTLIALGSTDIHLSTDGLNWQSVASYGQQDFLYDVIAADGHFLAVGRDAVSVSDDGTTFERILLP